MPVPAPRPSRSVPGVVPGVLAAFLLLLAGLLAPTPAVAAGPSYVALGDSYSSGTGTRSYIADGTDCLRSTYAYPSLVAAQNGYTLNLRACSGATIPDVTSTQLGALSASTSLVTLSVGGNDAGFADVLTTCALPWWASNCGRAIDRAQSFVRTTLPGRLSTLYADVRARAPQARVVIVGYPRIFNGEDCNALTFFSPSEERRLNETADLLDSVLRSQATARGFGFADPVGRFTGHAVCDDPEWLNGLSYPIEESYHPNRTGHASGYAPLVAPLLGALARRGTTYAERVPAATIRRSQAPYRAADRRIEPKTFRAPDLDSPALRRAARAHGIDWARWRARHS